MPQKAITAAGLIVIHVNANVTVGDFPKKVGWSRLGTLQCR